MSTECCAGKDKMKELKEFMAAKRDADHPDSSLIAVLHKAQGLFGYLSREVMDEIAVTMNVPTAHIWGVATFYHYFNLKPRGKNLISVCLGTACYVKGANDILDAIKKELKIGLGETTPDWIFSLQETRCLGACGLAPVMMINDKIYGELTPQKVVTILSGIREKAILSDK